MSANDLPPIFRHLPYCLQTDYMRAASKPLQRMKMLREHAERVALSDKDMQLFALEELRYAYNCRLPKGEYRNNRGHCLTVRDGSVSSINLESPPLPNVVWVPRHQRQLLERKLNGYHFNLGSWGMGEHTPPQANLPSFNPPAWQHSVQVPAGLEGATFRGFVPTLPPQPPHAGYVPNEPISAVTNSQAPELAADMACTAASAAGSPQQNIDFSIEDEQLFDIPALPWQQTVDWTTEDIDDEQHAIIPPPPVYEYRSSSPSDTSKQQPDGDAVGGIEISDNEVAEILRQFLANTVAT